ncbi:hypothetical protein AnigIFM63309_009469 [Aspergillus niger]|nr:hypothetical protein AnigIFM63309_009469 [Aspergillus niger]
MNQLNSKEEINEAIANHASFILMFTAVWSDVGNITKGKFESIGANYPTVYMAWVSTDDHPDLAKEWGFTAIPATVGYKNGTKVETYVGPQYLDQQVEAFIKKVI